MCQIKQPSRIDRAAPPSSPHIHQRSLSNSPPHTIPTPVAIVEIVGQKPVGGGRGGVVSTAAMIAKRVDLFDVEDGRSKVVDAVTEGAVDAVLDAMSARVGLVHARRRLEVAQVVAPLRVAGGPMEKRTVVAVGANARRFVVTRAVHVGRVAGGERESRAR